MSRWEKADEVPELVRKRKTKDRMQAEIDINDFLSSDDNIRRMAVPKDDMQRLGAIYRYAAKSTEGRVKIFQRNGYLYMEKSDD